MSGLTLAIGRSPRAADDGFATLYSEHYRRLVNVAMRRVDTTADAEDIVQESFGQLWRRRGSVTQPIGYLHTSVVNRCRDDLRRSQQRRRREHLLIDPPTDDREYLTDLVAGLSTGQRQVVVRRFYRGDTMREIAEATGQPIGTVKSSLHRALEDLRRSLDGVSP